MIEAHIKCAGRNEPCTVRQVLEALAGARGAQVCPRRRKELQMHSRCCALLTPLLAHDCRMTWQHWRPSLGKTQTDFSSADTKRQWSLAPPIENDAQATGGGGTNELTT